MNNSIRNQKGFTLIETLVAVTILTVGIAAPLTAVSRALNAADRSKDNISAFYFAQEGIEYIRHVRDTNILENAAAPVVNWLDDLSPRCTGPNGCGIENVLTNVTNGNLEFSNCAVANNCIINFDTGGVYGESGANATKFRRVIIVTETFANIEAEIVVTVDWNAKGTDYTYTLRETIFNWSGN